MTEKTVEFPNGLRYDGKVNKQGLPHGAGKVVYPDGSSYVGEWKVRTRSDGGWRNAEWSLSCPGWDEAGAGSSVRFG